MFDLNKKVLALFEGLILIKMVEKLHITHIPVISQSTVYGMVGRGQSNSVSYWTSNQ